MSLPKEVLETIKDLLIKSIENSEKGVKHIDNELETGNDIVEIERLKAIRKIFSDSITSDKKELENILKQL